MITAVAARWLLTVVFAAAGLGAALPRRGHHGAADAAGPVPVVSCVVMCAALTAMTWRSEPAAACIPWLARAIGPGPRVKDRVSASQAAMSAGMAAMLTATL